MKAVNFIDKKWSDNKLPLGVKEQWAELMEDYAKHYHTEQLKLCEVGIEFKEKQIPTLEKWTWVNFKQIDSDVFLQKNKVWHRLDVLEKYKKEFNI